ncbi:MAG TPA: hypothetical protein VFV78_06145 [Vicinamibacterales bacterium]|nr:hypothetical protein [Vicinamibacterales bacterium]
MSRTLPLLSLVVAVLVASTAVFAHGFEGTVVSATPAAITISVVDESTKKASPMTFDIGKQTKIQRGTKVVSFADAKIEKGEKVSIEIDHELDMHLAVVIKLDVKK